MLNTLIDIWLKAMFYKSIFLDNYFFNNYNCVTTEKMLLLK